MLKIRYLSHGLTESGGYRHEKALAKALASALTHCDDCYEEIRFKKNYRGFFAWIQLFLHAFSAAKADVIITVSRLAWPVYLRNLFTPTKIVLVLHNWDERDRKPRLFYNLLGAFLKLAAKRKHKISVVVVAQYWNNFISTAFGVHENLFTFPNFFENGQLQFYKDIARPNGSMVHLGQWSEKIDKKKYRLFVHMLQEAGMVCYFSDNSNSIVTEFPVIQMETPEAYYKQMAEAKCTVIFNKINEGWNRVAHESFLLGTPVIATDSGGLGELVRLAGGNIVANAQEAFAIIQSNNFGEINATALEKYDVSHAVEWVEPIAKWIGKSHE